MHQAVLKGVDRGVFEGQLRESARNRHQIFLVHILLCVPFLAIWLADPALHPGISATVMPQIIAIIGGAVLYFLGRACVVYFDLFKLSWEYIFPPIDVALISLLMASGDRNPLSHTSLLYLFPIAEAAGTLSIGWSVAVAAMVILGSAIATSFRTDESFATMFRYFFFMIVASSTTFLARANAATKGELSLLEDRNRIALEMHDGVQAHLVTAASQLELLTQIADKSPERAKSLSLQIRESVRWAADELRYLVFRNRPQSIQAGFIPALREFAYNVCARNDIDLKFEVIGEVEPIFADAEHGLFRVLQECLTNLLKHSNATEVVIRMEFKDEDLILEVRDNGIGFDAEKSEVGNGLASMRDRLLKLRGDLHLDSQPGRGTKILAVVPWSNLHS